MQQIIQNIKTTRAHLLNNISGLSTEQLNKIPAGFNNNIIWNLAHLVAAQQGICYMRSGLPVTVEEKYFDGYKPGTKPTGFVDTGEIDVIKDLLASTLDKLATDIEAGIFVDYTPVVTRYGVELKNITNAITFLPFHEGLHTGVISAMTKIV